MRRALFLVACTCLACGGAAYAPDIDPADFVAVIDNPLLPLTPGKVFTYRATDGDDVEDIVTTVTLETKEIMGVTCTVVHDVESIAGVLQEDTYDWYAQDKDGNVWYFGEDTTAYSPSGSSTAGSWEAGKEGAQPGIVMKGDPQVGDAYRQEYLEGKAEDEGEVLALDATATVPYGTFTGCVKTKDITRLEPNLLEHKTYCPDVGLVLAEELQPGSTREELITITQP